MLLFETHKYSKMWSINKKQNVFSTFCSFSGLLMYSLDMYYIRYAQRLTFLIGFIVFYCILAYSSYVSYTQCWVWCSVFPHCSQNTEGIKKIRIVQIFLSGTKWEKIKTIFYLM